MRPFTSVIQALGAMFVLSSCGGGKGCAYTSNTDAHTDIHAENIDINLGVIDGRHVEDGRIIVRMTIPDDAKAKLQTYFDRASMKEGFEPQLAHLAQGALVRKSEANLPFGSKNVKDWGEYFCSDLRFFLIKDSDKQYLGAQTAARVIGLRNSTSVHSEEFRSPPPTRRDIRELFPDFYEGEFDIAIEAGTVLLPDDRKDEELIFRFILTTLTYTYDSGSFFNDPGWPEQSPLCGPYVTDDADMGSDDMDSDDMAPHDMAHDLAPDLIDTADMSDDTFDDLADQNDFEDMPDDM